ncbi:hypothetical protein KR009_007554 [Drosophila setifemur]|nr:hypothetical protein KR009_007554 [Drosophila setifemur]
MPRPHSKKSIPKPSARFSKATLGDEDTGSEDDETPFQSPELGDATDYGLEFTTSRLTLQDARNRRCSTLRKDTSATRRARANRSSSSDEDTDEENRTPPARSPQTRNRSSGQAHPQQKQQAQPRTPQQPQHRAQPRTPLQQQQRAQPRTPQQQQQRAQPRPAPQGANRRKISKPVSRALKMEREIQRLQASAGNLIPKLPFSRLVREVIYQNARDGQNWRITEGALQALQSSCELYLTQRLQDAYLLTMHRGRVTLEVRDMVLMAYICDQNGHR